MAASGSFRFPAYNFIKRRFSVNFAKFKRISFERTPPDDSFLCLSVNFGSFSEYFFL